MRARTGRVSEPAPLPRKVWPGAANLQAMANILANNHRAHCLTCDGAGQNLSSLREANWIGGTETLAGIAVRVRSIRRWRLAWPDLADKGVSCMSDLAEHSAFPAYVHSARENNASNHRIIESNCGKLAYYSMSVI